jgi:hypothetical protein
MSSYECEQILFKIPVNDKVQAQQIIDEAFAAKCSQFEAHRAHRVCFIRLGIDQALQNLVDARDMMMPVRRASVIAGVRTDPLQDPDE